jgi:hypothetical protein
MLPPLGSESVALCTLLRISAGSDSGMMLRCRIISKLFQNLKNFIPEFLGIFKHCHPENKASP